MQSKPSVQVHVGPLISSLSNKERTKSFSEIISQNKEKTQPKTPHTLKALCLKSTGKLVYLDAYNVLSMYTFCSLKQSLQDCRTLLTDLQEAVMIPFRTEQTVQRGTE